MRYYRATFETIGTVYRSSQSRVYTHAWTVQGESGQMGGFSGSEELARRAANGVKWARIREVEPVEEIDAKTYRARGAS